jgi:transcriptional regulator with XRE-family HTH domain
MKQTISNPDELGLVIRAVRKSTRVRQDDMAGSARVSRQFASSVEKGKSTAQIGLVFLLLKELGISLTADIPDAAGAALATLKTKEAQKKARKPARRPAPLDEAGES